METMTCELETVPAEIDLIVSAREAGTTRPERRALRRRHYRVRASLHLFKDLAGGRPVSLFIRDIDARGAGFVASRCLPLGYGGLLELPGVDDRIARVHCTVLRCRVAGGGWYEGALSFNRAQPQFAL